MWVLVTYSNYFEIVSTVTFPVLQTRLKFVFNAVLLYHYTINNDYAWYNMCSTWFLDIRNQLVYIYHILENIHPSVGQEVWQSAYMKYGVARAIFIQPCSICEILY